MHPIRKLIQKTGFDLHRYRPATDKLAYLRSLDLGTVLDIGANTGQFAREIRQRLPEAQIYSFEPLKGPFQTLETSFRKDPKFKAFNYALGDMEGEVEMHKSVYSPSSSLLPMSDTHKELFPHTKENTQEKIIIKRLDDVAKNLELEKEVLIKVDVQGFEQKVLDGGIQAFGQAKALIIEVSFLELYKDQPSFDTLYQKLKSLGFEYKGSLEQKIGKSGQIISEDSLFILK